MKKRLLAICLTFIMLLTLLTGCTEETEFMSVSSEKVSQGLFTYYLDCVLSSPEEYGIQADDRDAAISCAVECCKKYVATINFMKENSISLTTQNKQSVATQVEQLWSLFSAYYTSIGVSKSDLTEAVSHEYRKKLLVDYYYGPNGLEPVDEDDLKEEFVDLYVGFRAVTADLTKVNAQGETVPLNDDERELLLSMFKLYAQRINEGLYTIDEVNVAYNNTIDIIVTESLEINVVRIGDPMYNESFFEQLMDVSHTKAAVIECGNTLYLVQREKIATTDEDEFYLYRSELLEVLKMPEIEQKVDSLAAGVECDFDKSTAKDIYKHIYDSEKVGSDTADNGARMANMPGIPDDAYTTE